MTTGSRIIDKLIKLSYTLEGEKITLLALFWKAGIRHASPVAIYVKKAVGAHSIQIARTPTEWRSRLLKAASRTKSYDPKLGE